MKLICKFFDFSFCLSDSTENVSGCGLWPIHKVLWALWRERMRLGLGLDGAQLLWGMVIPLRPDLAAFAFNNFKFRGPHSGGNETLVNHHHSSVIVQVAPRKSGSNGF
jgi:hypothetical protein